MSDNLRGNVPTIQQPTAKRFDAGIEHNYFTLRPETTANLTLMLSSESTAPQIRIVGDQDVGGEPSQSNFIIGLQSSPLGEKMEKRDDTGE